jgi:hypothetical protein
MVAGDADEAERVLRIHIRHTSDMLAAHSTPSVSSDGDATSQGI